MSVGDYFQQLMCFMVLVVSIDIESLKNRLLKVCYVPATSTPSKASFFAAIINSTNEANKAGSTCC
jgi:hypothetical protein